MATTQEFPHGFCRTAFLEEGPVTAYPQKNIFLMPPADFLQLSFFEKDTRQDAREAFQKYGYFNTLPAFKVKHGQDILLGIAGRHNGRHRATVLVEHGYTSMPVLIILQRKFKDTRPWPKTIKAHYGSVDPEFSVPFPPLLTLDP
jgi:hypothetical protein